MTDQKLLCPKCKSIDWEEGDTEVDCDIGVWKLQGICKKCGTVFSMKFVIDEIEEEE